MAKITYSYPTWKILINTNANTTFKINEIKEFFAISFSLFWAINKEEYPKEFAYKIVAKAVKFIVRNAPAYLGIHITRSGIQSSQYTLIHEKDTHNLLLTNELSNESEHNRLNEIYLSI